MKRLFLKEIFEKNIVDSKAIVKGWVRSVRKSKKFSFIVLNDGSCQRNLQIIIDADLEGYDKLSTMLAGTSVSLEGQLVVSGGRNPGIEMQGAKGTIIGESADNYPLQKKATSLEFLRDIAHFRPRTNLFGAVFRIRHALSIATHKFFDEKGFYYVHTPIISAIDGEGAGEMFKVTTMDLCDIKKNDKGEVDFSHDYFEKEVSLAVTGQLEGECFASGMGSIYTFGPTFRSENSNTPRHLSEFWMIEPEVAFADLDDVATLAADYIKYLIDYAFKNCQDELDFLSKREEVQDGHLDILKHVGSSEFKKITYTKAIEILDNSNQNFEYPTNWGDELQTEHEKYLCEKHFNSPVIVTDYPKEFKAFYMKQNDDDKTVRAMDVLVPGVGEIIGGSQREENLDKLIKRMDKDQMEKEGYWWYLDLRRFGSVPHSGFGLGFERAVMYITGMKNIRDVIPFPRTPRNCDF